MLQDFSVYPATTNFVSGSLPLHKDTMARRGNNWDIVDSKYLGIQNRDLRLPSL